MKVNRCGGWLGYGNSTDEGVRMVCLSIEAGRIRMGLASICLLLPWSEKPWMIFFITKGRGTAA